MSNYEANTVNTIEGYTKRDGGRLRAVTGTVEVRPPLVIGERFTDAVLGKNQIGIRIGHVCTTDEATTLVVEVPLYDTATREQMVDQVGARIAELLNGERDAATMMAENPFPLPYSTR